MALSFKRGDTVRQIVPAPIVGTVAELAVSGDSVIARVEWTDEQGQQQSRWFDESQVVAVVGDDA